MAKDGSTMALASGPNRTLRALKSGHQWIYPAVALASDLFYFHFGPIVARLALVNVLLRWTSHLDQPHRDAAGLTNRMFDLGLVSKEMSKAS
jgi:hypothetical protein